MKSKILNSAILVCIILLINGYLVAQNDKDSSAIQNYEPSLNFSYLKNTDGIKILTCNIQAKKDKKIMSIENAVINFYAGNESEVKLGSVKSDKNGRAVFEIKPDVQLPMNDTGLVKYTAEYKGEKNSESAKEELSIKDVFLEMTLNIVDSVKKVSLKATKYGKNKEIVPLGDIEIKIFVKRLYSDLEVGKVNLDAATGEGSVEFPVIPGDSVGNVILIARVDNNEVYGSVEKRTVINWGTPVVYQYNRIGPALWSSHAPIWMTITLYIFLIGVWYHLILVFRKLYKVKKIGKALQKNKETK